MNYIRLLWSVVNFCSLPIDPSPHFCSLANHFCDLWNIWLATCHPWSRPSPYQQLEVQSEGPWHSSKLSETNIFITNLCWFNLHTCVLLKHPPPTSHTFPFYPGKTLLPHRLWNLFPFPHSCLSAFPQKGLPPTGMPTPSHGKELGHPWRKAGDHAVRGDIHFPYWYAHECLYHPD